MSSPLTDEQKGIFEVIRNDHENFALLSGKFQEHDVAYVCAAVEEDDGSVTMKPVAIIVDRSFLDRFGDQMKDPDGVVPSENPEAR